MKMNANKQREKDRNVPCCDLQNRGKITLQCKKRKEGKEERRNKNDE